MGLSGEKMLLLSMKEVKRLLHNRFGRAINGEHSVLVNAAIADCFLFKPDCEENAISRDFARLRCPVQFNLGYVGLPNCSIEKRGL